jgi:hypothetical protein
MALALLVIFENLLQCDDVSFTSKLAQLMATLNHTASSVTFVSREV